jgi:ferredoxin-NADP reductase
MNKLLKFSAEVIRNENITPTVFELEFIPDIDFQFDAGQFLQITLADPREEGKTIKRSYSIASNPENKSIMLCIKLVEDGLGTPQLKNLKIGDKIQCTAPFGKFTYKTEPNRYPVFIATGTGIAPFYSMLKSLEHHAKLPIESLCLLGVRSEDEVLYDNYFKNISGLTWQPCVSQASPSWKGFRGRVSGFLRDNHVTWDSADYYLCGNGAMIKEIKELLQEKGVDKSKIHQEIYFT